MFLVFFKFFQSENKVEITGNKKIITSVEQLCVVHITGNHTNFRFFFSFFFCFSSIFISGFKFISGNNSGNYTGNRNSISSNSGISGILKLDIPFLKPEIKLENKKFPEKS